MTEIVYKFCVGEGPIHTKPPVLKPEALGSGIQFFSQELGALCSCKDISDSCQEEGSSLKRGTRGLPDLLPPLYPRLYRQGIGW